MGNPVDADVYAEDPALTQMRLGCRSIISPLLRRCNFNIETGSKQISIVGVSPQHTAIDCGLSYDSDCPNESCEHVNFDGLPLFSIPRRGLHLTGGSALNNVSVGHCMATRWSKMGRRTFWKSDDKFGGCVYFPNADLRTAVLEGVLMHKCTASNGGCAFVESKVALNNVSAVQCSSGTGAIHSNGDLVWTEGVIERSYAYGWAHNWGGSALRAFQGTVQLLNVRIRNNYAKGSSFGVGISHTCQSTSRVALLLTTMDHQASQIFSTRQSHHLRQRHCSFEIIVSIAPVVSW